MTRSVVRKGWEDPPNRVLDELWGPIDTDPTSEWYMGASEGANNTGELTGIAQALLRMKKGGGKEEAAICYDSMLRNAPRGSTSRRRTWCVCNCARGCIARSVSGEGARCASST